MLYLVHVCAGDGVTDGGERLFAHVRERYRPVLVALDPSRRQARFVIDSAVGLGPLLLALSRKGRELLDTAPTVSAMELHALGSSRADRSYLRRMA